MVVGKDFSTVSGDILDFLKSISGTTYIYTRIQCIYSSIGLDLKCCVFSFACESPGNPLYLETLEERYDIAYY